MINYIFDFIGNLFAGGSNVPSSIKGAQSAVFLLVGGGIGISMFALVIRFISKIKSFALFGG